MFVKISELIGIFNSYLSGEISYEEYSKAVRKTSNLVFIFAIVSFAFLLTGLFVGIPIKVIFIGILDMLYLIILQSKATTVKKQALYNSIWALSSFLLAALILFIAVEFFGYMN